MTLSQCGTHRNKNTNPILGTYELAGRDHKGQRAFAGTISFVSIEQNHLKGPCKITWQQNAPEGLLDKDGNCEAMMDGNKISFDSAPSLDDAGLLLEGEFDGVTIRGNWMIDAFVTSQALGKFEAVKKQ